MARTKIFSRRRLTRQLQSTNNPVVNSPVNCLSQIIRDIPNLTIVNENTFDLSHWQETKQPEYYNGSWPPGSLEDLLGFPHELEECVCRKSFCQCEYQRFVEVTALASSDTVTIQQTESKGYGVFSRHSLKQGQVLGEYAGQLVPIDLEKSDEETQYVADIAIGRANLKRGALTEKSEQAICWIDATRTGSIFQFLNHSCECNTEFVWARVGMERRVLKVVTTKPIEAGEEITMNYGELYWEDDETCYCGSKNCSHPARTESSNPPAEDGVQSYSGISKRR